MCKGRTGYNVKPVMAGCTKTEQIISQTSQTPVACAIPFHQVRPKKIFSFVKCIKKKTNKVYLLSLNCLRCTIWLFSFLFPCSTLTCLRSKGVKGLISTERIKVCILSKQLFKSYFFVYTVFFIQTNYLVVRTQAWDHMVQQSTSLTFFGIYWWKLCTHVVLIEQLDARPRQYSAVT